jgi:hypothetical protein
VEEKSFEESPKELREEMDQKKEQPMIIEEFEIEELSVDGICRILDSYFNLCCLAAIHGTGHIGVSVAA